MEGRGGGGGERRGGERGEEEEEWRYGETREVDMEHRRVQGLSHHRKGGYICPSYSLIGT